jgi:hypothetical protein
MKVATPSPPYMDRVVSARLLSRPLTQSAIAATTARPGGSGRKQNPHCGRIWSRSVLDWVGFGTDDKEEPAGSKERSNGCDTRARVFCSSSTMRWMQTHSRTTSRAAVLGEY